MIPILYDKNETAFASNGLGRLGDCISCFVTEERNGEYELEMEYPISGVHFDDITNGRIIAATHDEVGDVQPFDIYRISEPINGIVTINAHHISYRLNEIVVKPFTASNCSAAIAGLKTNSVNTNPFTFWTDKSVNGSYSVLVPSTLRGCLCGEEGSLLDVYGAGEYDFDLFNVKLYTTRGQDTPVTISYGKNLVDYLDEYDDSESFNAVAPYWSGTVTNSATGEDEDTVITISEGYVTNGNPVDSGRTVVVPLDMSDVFENAPTTAQLKTAATSFINVSNAYRASRNVTIDFVQLWKTEEYKQYAPLQRVNLCDTVLVNVPMYNVYNLRIKVIKTVYNVLLDRYDEIELGDPRQSFADTLTSELSVQIKTAQTEALKAAKIAGNNTQHFWFTSTGLDTGAHITEVARETFLNDPNNGGPNLLARSNGVAVRNGLTELATFSASEARIGPTAGGHTTIQASGMQIYGNAGADLLANIGYGAGEDDQGVTVNAPFFTFGKRASNTVGNYSVAEGYNTEATGYASHAEGVGTVASGGRSHAEGGVATINGVGTPTVASGGYAHAEGGATLASGDLAHAEGFNTTASGPSSHAEGEDTVASAYASHAQNFGTVAASPFQTALGQFNVVDANDTYALIIGNGASNIRSNALTVDWDGKIRAEGHSSPIGNTNSTSGSKTIASGESSTALSSSFALGAGTFILIGCANFPANATGVRFAAWYDETAQAIINHSRMTVGATGNVRTRVQTVAIVSHAVSTSYTLYCYQTSGSSMTVNYDWAFVRIV